MNDSKDLCGENTEKTCNSRRDFLVKATAITGGFVLSLAGAQSASAQNPATAADDDVVLKLDDKSPLGKVGGSQVVDSKNGKVIIVRTGEMAFSAYSAICTHKGGILKYDMEKKLLVCPLHGSKFDAEGKVLGGPAKQNLPVYSAQESVVVTLTPKV